MFTVIRMFTKILTDEQETYLAVLKLKTGKLRNPLLPDASSSNEQIASPTENCSTSISNNGDANAQNLIPVLPSKEAPLLLSSLM